MTVMAKNVKDKKEKPLRLRMLSLPVAQPPLPSYEKAWSETWHTLLRIMAVNAFYQKRDYGTSLAICMQRGELNE